MAAASYATLAELKTYVKSLGTDYDTLLTQILSEASRRVDDEIGRYFYADGISTKYFDGSGTSRQYILGHDFYAVTALKMALTENAALASMVTISGDGLTPPTNFALEPANPAAVGSASDQTSKRPFYILTIPATAKAGSTTDYQGIFTAGKRTISITANWGWPAIADEIKALTIRLSLRIFAARQSNFTGLSGAPVIGTLNTKTQLDDYDMQIVTKYQREFKS